MNDESTCSARSRSDEDVTRAALAVEADAFTRFIERQRIEVMFELRRLRFGERPVTGQSNRERIETFLTNIREQQQQDKRVPSRRPAVPSAHIADIDALASRRCVSATLSSPAFRRDLENAIRQSIGARPTTTVQTIPRAPPLPRTLAPVSATAHSYVGSVDREQEHSSTSPTQSHRQFNVERYQKCPLSTNLVRLSCSQTGARITCMADDNTITTRNYCPGNKRSRSSTIGDKCFGE